MFALRHSAIAIFFILIQTWAVIHPGHLAHRLLKSLLVMQCLYIQGKSNFLEIVTWNRDHKKQKKQDPTCCYQMLTK